MKAQLSILLGLLLVSSSSIGAEISQIYVVNGGKLATTVLGWKVQDSFVTGAGKRHDLRAKYGLGRGDFHIIARLRILKQRKSAASFFLDGMHFGFEGSAETVFVNGGAFGGLKLLRPATEVFEREAWIDFEAIRRAGEIMFLIDGRKIISVKDDDREYSRIGLRPWRATLQVERFSIVGNLKEPPGPTKFAVPLIDLDQEKHRQVIVDREKGQYLGHSTTCLLEDGKTILCVYPKGHGRGPIVYKRSGDGGLTWSDRLPTPASWATSKEVPTLHRVIDADGTKRIIMWSGLYPARLAVTEDDGR